MSSIFWHASCYVINKELCQVFIGTDLANNFVENDSHYHFVFDNDYHFHLGFENGSQYHYHFLFENDSRFQRGSASHRGFLTMLGNGGARHAHA